MSLVETTAFKSVRTPLKTVSLPAEAYVLALASSPSLYAAAASAPTNAIHLFDKSRLDGVQTLTGHAGGVTALRSSQHFAGTSSPVFISCGKDGTVKAWDARSDSVGLKMTALTSGHSRALLSCDISANGMLLAAGTELQGEDASIVYWDPRSPAAPLRVHSSTHSDDITGIHFQQHPEHTAHIVNVLLSVSSDGLVCTSNPDEEDEDEAGIYVGNWGCSIAQAGWVYGQGAPRVWASSDMETFSVWSSEFDRLQDVDIRQPSVHRQDLTWVTDYLIGCHNYSTLMPDSDNELCLFAGSNEGDIALLTIPALSDASVPWRLHQTWTTGHIGVVRSSLWDEKNNILLTGGEDSKLNVWSSPVFPSSDDGRIKRESSVEPMDVDQDNHAPIRKRRRS